MMEELRLAKSYTTSSSSRTKKRKRSRVHRDYIFPPFGKEAKKRIDSVEARTQDLLRM
jgi:hypothetical protein